MEDSALSPKRRSADLRFRLLLVLFTACGSTEGTSGASSEVAAGDRSPEAVCKHVGGFVSSLKETECVDEFQLLQRMDAKGWNCVSNCASGVKTEDAFNRCLEVCAKLSPHVQAQVDLKKELTAFGGDGSAHLRWELTKPFLVGKKSLEAELETETEPVKFKITLHEDTIPPVERAPSITFLIDDKKHDPTVVDAPSVTVDLRQGTPKEVLDQVVASLEPEAKAEKKEVDDAGYVAYVVMASSLRVYTGKVHAGKLLACDATLHGEASVMKKADALPALEKLCRSATLR